MPDDATVRSAAREVVANLVSRPVKDSEPLISSGTIDSLSILKLITQLEKKLHVSIPTETLQPDDFDSVELIVETVQRVVRV
jgi:acyl carrier protein